MCCSKKPFRWQYLILNSIVLLFPFVVSAQQPDAQLRLRLIKDSLNTDEVVMQFNKQDSTQYGYNKDALDLGGIGALESLSLVSSDNVYLSIYGVPYPQSKPETIPLLVDATASGSYQLKKIELNDMPALYQVWLKDAFMKDSLNLSIGETYDFKIDKINAATFGTKRFYIVISQTPSPAYHNIVKNGISIYPNPASGMINLAINTNGNTSSTYTIRITNTSGLLIKQAISNQADWHYSIVNLLPGYYFISVISNKDNSLAGESRFVKM